MVTVSISETYDLSTVKDKMTLIGIHTPKKDLITKNYPGLCMNYKYCRIVKTDVVLSAVSGTVAITPDMVGDNSVDGIAPEDVLNPILYKATSNDSWSLLEARLQGLYQTNFVNPSLNPLNGNMAFAENDDVTTLSDEFGVYYSLLSNRDGFKIAPIQAGLEMRGLVPLVFEKYYSHGENYNTTGDAAPGIISTGESPSLALTTITARSMRGAPHRMPRFNTTYLTGVGPSASSVVQGTDYQLNGMGSGNPANFQIEMPDIIPVMLGCILMPPCRKTKLFFRMTVRTYISFEECRPMSEISTFGSLNTHFASEVYHSDYNTQSKNMDATTDMVDVKNAEIEKIMEGR